MSLTSMAPEVHFLDLCARHETMAAIQGQPVLLQLPVVPAYALTVHKTQALSIKHRVNGCLEGVFAQGQVYVLVSRVTDPANFCLVGLPPADLVEDVAAALSNAGVDVDGWFRRAVTVTNEWVLHPGRLPFSERLKPRYRSSRAALSLRTLAESLDPMPRAREIVAELLSYFDRADLASQAGAPRPAFETPAGEPIFPEDEAWWLPELLRPKDPEEPQEDKGDEDGPPSEDDAPAEHMSDSDPMSDGVADVQDRAGLGRDPLLAWRGRAHAESPPQAAGATDQAPADPPQPYPGHFETQVLARCGQHALNNALSRSFATVADLEKACDEVLRAARQEGSAEIRANHVAAGGWYSAEVLAIALQTASMANAGRVEYTMSLEPLCVNSSAIRAAQGAVVNIGNRHWVALRWESGHVFLLDSMEPRPIALSWEAYLAFINTNRAAYCISAAPQIA